MKSQARSKYPPLQPCCPLLLQESRCCALRSTSSAPLLMIANRSDATSAVEMAQDAPHHPWSWMSVISRGQRVLESNSFGNASGSYIRRTGFILYTCGDRGNFWAGNLCPSSGDLRLFVGRCKSAYSHVKLEKDQFRLHELRRSSGVSTILIERYIHEQRWSYERSLIRKTPAAKYGRDYFSGGTLALVAQAEQLT